MKKLEIPLPPVEEQRAVAGVLGVVDSVIAKTDEVIAKTERLKKGLMQTLLTRGIGHKEFKNTEIGRIPKDWRIIKLNDKALVKEGVYGKRSSEGRIIQLKADSIGDYGRINPKAYALISVDRDISEYFLKPGDILLSNRNSEDLVGKVAIFKGELDLCVFSNLLTRIRVCSTDLLPEWLLYILTKMWHDGVLRALGTRAVNQVLLRKGIVERLKIPLPPLEEQQKIVKILSTVDEKLEIERREKAKLEIIKQGLMELLLTGKVRVKVDCGAVCSG
jgi:type I restriction enzyme S subunit